MASTRVLVVGAGKRVRRTILPALSCLRETHAIEAVVARSRRAMTLGPLSFETRLLDDVDLDAVDLAIIAVSTQEVPAVLRGLRRDPAKLRLLVDTPVFNPRDLRSGRLLRDFAAVSVAEDSLTLPPLLLARRLVDAGRIGRLRHVTMQHAGFKHHAVAALRMLARSRSVAGARERRWHGDLGEIELRLGGVRARIVEPRDYEVGRLFLAGDEGAIVDYGLSPDVSPVHRIAYETVDGRFRGLRLDGEPVEPNALDEAHRRHLVEFPAVSLMDDMKVRGLMDLIVDAVAADPRHRYQPVDAVYDATVINVLRKAGRFRDLPAPGGSVLRGVLAAAMG